MNPTPGPSPIKQAESKLDSMRPIEINGIKFATESTDTFGLILRGPTEVQSADYLHEVLLSPDHREAFFGLIESEGLVVCRNVTSNAASYRRVRGKSSPGKLSQAEYYHHDGCSCPTKPRIVEIRMPHQKVAREIATAIAPFSKVIKAMLRALPNHLSGLSSDSEIQSYTQQFLDGDPPPAEQWDKIQGRVTRMVRRELDAESCRAYFRDVDSLAEAYVEPWEMGESRLMLNSHDDLPKTMQHRRSYQKPRGDDEQNGSLVKRWTAEEA